MNIRSNLFLILSMLLLGYAAEAQIRQGYIIYQNGDSTEARGRVTGDVLATNAEAHRVFQTVMDKIKAQGGGKVEIESGTFAIDQPVRVFSDTEVVGSGKSTLLTLGASNAQQSGVIFRVSDQDRVTLADMRCHGAASNDSSSAILLERTSFTTVRNVYAADFSGYGFWLKDDSFACKFENNYTSGNDRAGTMIQGTQHGKTRGGRFVPNKIVGCYSYAEDGHGFEFYKAICQDIVSSVVYLAKGHGIYMRESTSNLISGNRIFMGEKDGILIEDTYEMNISSNICGWNWGDNLTLNHCVWGTVSANEFIDAGGREREGYGIYMKRGTKAMQISGNAIFNWWDNQALTTGIYEGEDCLENQITDNVINYYKKSDVESLGENSVASNNLGLPHPYGWPAYGPDVPNVKPEDIVLNLHIDESRELAEAYLEAVKKSIDEK